MKAFVLTTIVALSLAAYGMYNVYSPSTPKTFGSRLAEIADHVNSANTTWTATTYPRFSLLQAQHEVKALLGSKPKTEESKLRYQKARVTYANSPLTAPESFDSRQNWPKCDSIRDVRDQSNCGSCWAVSSASAMSDRWCIDSNQTNQTRISSTDVLACCSECGDGCDGGQEDVAFQHWTTHGYVTGNEYGNDKWCKPYSFQPCAHHVTVPGLTPCDQLGPEYPTPECKRECSSSTYATDYKSDLKMGASYQTFSGESDIKIEIANHGPVVTGFEVFEDFMTYKGGVYQHVTGGSLGGHAVRVIGYGSENGTDYWLVANSWNENWGEKGLFRILRGVNHCGFEADMVGGHAKLD